MGTWVVRKDKSLSPTDKKPCRDERKLQVEELDKSGGREAVDHNARCDSQPHPPTKGVPMNTTIAQDVETAARRMYDAECALHIAHQTGVDQWVKAAGDRLHEAVVAYRRPLQALARAA